jgi:hypothetical protein
MKPTLFTFEKIDGKWSYKLNGDWFFVMKTEKGIPFDLAIEIVNRLDWISVVAHIVHSWDVFVKENNIYISEIKQDWAMNKDVYIDRIDKELAFIV